MAKKKVDKKARRLVFFGTISILVIFYFGFYLCYYSYKLAVLKTSKADLEEQLSSLQEQEEVLKTDIEKLKDPEYIAKYARENYMYSKDGEYIIKVEDEEAVVESQNSEYDYQYLIFVSVGCLVIVILYIVLRARKI